MNRQVDKAYKLSNNYSLFQGDFKESRYYLFNIEDGTIFRLNEVSYNMLSQFDGFKNTNEILSLLKDQYKVEGDKIEADFKALLNIWLQKNILLAGRE